MSEVTSVVVRMKHIREAKICASGAREFWKHHGLDYMDFLANGIPAERLLETRDPRAVRVVEIAEADNGR